jgi:hypothetical protein
MGYSGYKMKDVGSGAGKMIGGGIAGPVGTVIGHYIGKDAPRHPEDPADETRKSHRVALLTDERLRAKRLAIASAIGAIVSGVDADANAGDVDANVVVPGGLIGTGLGFLGGTSVGGWKGAKKLGYGTLGKLSATVPLPGELTGLTVPKKIKIAGYDAVNGRNKK